jgi:type I restriction enzyme R subunit
MPIENFIVRPKRRLVEKYSEASTWEELGVIERGELVREVAGLPSGIADSDLDAKKFDLLLLGLQLAMLRVEPHFDSLKESVIEIASALEEKQAIPMVRDQILLIQEVQRTQFWQGVTVPELEQVRVKLRALVKFIERSRRDPVYTNFEDEMRASELIVLAGVSAGVDTERFREKALAFLRDKLEEPALHKVRWNEPLTTADLESLEEMLVEAGIGTADSFIAERQLNGSQLDFINLVIDHLTQCGWMRPEQLYSSPFTDDFSGGPNSVFAEHQAVQALISTLSAVERNATDTAVSE